MENFDVNPELNLSSVSSIEEVEYNSEAVGVGEFQIKSI